MNVSSQSAGKPEDPKGTITLKQRDALFRLHKALLESERAAYEKSVGHVGSPYHFLQLLTSDPWFGWLQPFSQLIAAIDESLDAKEPERAADLGKLFNQVRAMLVASEGDDGFSGHYYEALQRDPDVLFAHAEASRALRHS
jgi:hypothetical protein